ncbi:hypothetical protein [Rhodococcus sp. GA1]|uniref:hypothetical protein n=1 Tax=Rhodococcus sp. GA1 TaxID=2942275 RepID=UPI0020CEE5F6|nr:hypothetical protein [Rhodococcus sp. GA1]
MSDSIEPCPYGERSEPAWPQRFRTGSLCLGVFLAGAGILVLQKTMDDRRADDLGAIALGFCLALMTALGSAWGFERAGFHRFGLHPRIRQCRDDIHGPGIEIPYVRILPVQLSAVFSCITVSGAFMIRASNRPDGAMLLARHELPHSGSFIAWTTCATVAVCALPFLIHPRGSTRLHADGIRRRTTWLVRRGVSDVFVRWDEIQEVDADVYTVSGRGASTHNPLIRLHVPGYEPTPPRVAHDKPDSFTVPAYVLVSDPNTLLGLIDRLHGCPEDRHLVTTPEAPELLRPLPVRERLRIARKIPRQQREW